MGVQENDLTKICSFYVSDWHLITMLLPYINNKVNEQTNIAMILENEIKDNVETLVEKLNLKNKEKILNLNWSSKQDIKNIFNSINNNNEIILIINGEYKYIERQNIKIFRYLQKNKVNNNIKIINCYDLNNFNGSVQNIIEDHDKMLNTSGEKEIDEVFKIYKNKIKIS